MSRTMGHWRESRGSETREAELERYRFGRRSVELCGGSGPGFLAEGIRLCVGVSGARRLCSPDSG